MTEEKKAAALQRMRTIFSRGVQKYRFTDVRDLALWAIHSEYLEPICWAFAASEIDINKLKEAIDLCFGKRVENTNTDVWGHWLSLHLKDE